MTEGVVQEETLPELKSESPKKANAKSVTPVEGREVGTEVRVEAP